MNFSDLQDQNFFFGEGDFIMSNGDTYTGEYFAHRRGLVWKEGYGIYRTKDGEIYEGKWLNDKLRDNELQKIKFSNGDEFCGYSIDEKFDGPGTLTLECKMDISCMFKNNKPVEEVTLIDINGRIWQGQAEEDHTSLLPENHFYLNLSDTGGMGEPKYKYKDYEAKETSSGEIELSDKDWRKIIFAKSTKTSSAYNFRNSKWYQRYLRYETMLSTIAKKIKKNEPLSEDESKWYKKALENRTVVKTPKRSELEERFPKKCTSHIALLEERRSKVYKERWPVMKVFYPKSDK
ncbi:hypothetical protein FQA39_LY01434 [Lamprigera yunnana]|nr:hypothetical protein FQA39_LY01434 [Lamprigera yunnana]